MTFTDTFPTAESVTRRGRLPLVILAAGGILVACATGGGLSSKESHPPTATTAPAALKAVPGTVIVPGSEHVEVSQYGADTFKDYRNTSGKGGHIDVGQRVLVDCVVLDGPLEAAPSARGLWYHGIGPDDQTFGFTVAGRFLPANTFWNQEPPQPPDHNQPYDALVPQCPPDIMSRVQP